MRKKRKGRIAEAIREQEWHEKLWREGQERKRAEAERGRAEYERLGKTEFERSRLGKAEAQRIKEKAELKCSYCNTILEGNAMFCKLCGRDTKKSRHIPASVKKEVWRRDEGKCVECGSKERLEYDHIIPFSKGGSNTARNIQLLCEKCNREKYNQI